MDCGEDSRYRSCVGSVCRRSSTAQGGGALGESHGTSSCPRPFPRLGCFSYPTIAFPDSLLLAGKEGHPGEAKVMSIHEDILDKQVGAATVL